MKYLPLFLVLVTSLCFAETVNKKYSNKAFPYHGLSFKDRPVSEFNNTIIRGSCFHQECREGEEVVKDIFPDGMVGVVFDGCNLDNIYVDETKNIVIKDTVTRCLHRKLQVQNDGETWILDTDLKPIEPMNKEQRLKAGVSINPKDIPKEKFTNGERDAFENSLNTAVVSIP